jgi:hypothetical protein
MCAKVGHDNANAVRSDALGMTELDPIHLGVGKQPVQKDERPPLPKLPPG